MFALLTTNLQGSADGRSAVGGGSIATGLRTPGSIVPIAMERGKFRYGANHGSDRYDEVPGKCPTLLTVRLKSVATTGWMGGREACLLVLRSVSHTSNMAL